MFEKTAKQKAFDYVAEIVQKNIRKLNSLSKCPENIAITENAWGRRYIALEDVYKLMDNNFEEHFLI